MVLEGEARTWGQCLVLSLTNCEALDECLNFIKLGFSQPQNQGTEINDL